MTDHFSEEEKSYELPDESVITIDAKTRYRCTETMFTY
jgi:CMP-N-acetylneuraminic acid synthetase